MNCREFSELADSYLSDELLVETNHGLIRHLESCRACRTVLAERREMRETLRRAVKNSASPDPAFAAGLREAMRARYSRRIGPTLLPAFGVAVLVFAVLLGATVYLRNSGQTLESAKADVEDAVRRSGLMEFLHDAFGNHKSCGLKFGKNAARPAPDDQDFAALRKDFAADLEFVEKHDCVYKGRTYNHTILRRGDRLISILRTKSGMQGDAAETIVSMPIEQMQVAEFEADGTAVFVISDLTENENMQIARVISKRPTA